MSEVDALKKHLTEYPFQSPVEEDWRQLLLVIDPAGSLRCKIIDVRATVARPVRLERGQSESYPDPLRFTSIATSGTGLFLTGRPADARAQLHAAFLAKGVVAGDFLVFSKDEGRRLTLRLYIVEQGTPIPILSETVDDDREHRAPITI